MSTTTVPDHDCIAIVAANIMRWGDRYPNHATTGGVYPLLPAAFGEPLGGNTSWTTGFVPGMLWLAHDLTGDETFADAALAHVVSFADRARRDIDMDHHDMGFLYTLSCTTAWRARRDPSAREAGIIAANQLMRRVLEPAGIIQAWGNLDDPNERARAIIDSLMNLPLLFWAGAVTGNGRYAEVATRHAQQLGRSIVRDDDTTFHTFHWDPATGEPTYGSTHQGAHDDSCWARGQAWGIYGFTLNHLHTGDPDLLHAARRCADYFIAHLPEDRVPYWDLIYGDGSGEERDTSAAAIAVCGLSELARATGEDRYQMVADDVLDALIRRHAVAEDDSENCLLRDGVYHMPAQIGVREGNLWGDYYYLEALVRRNKPAWEPYWLPSEKDA